MGTEAFDALRAKAHAVTKDLDVHALVADLRARLKAVA